MLEDSSGQAERSLQGDADEVRGQEMGYGGCSACLLSYPCCVGAVPLQDLLLEVSTEADRGLGMDPAATNTVQVPGEWVAACRRCLLGEPRALGCVPRSRGGLGGAARAAAQEAAGFEQGRKHIVLHHRPVPGARL